MKSPLNTVVQPAKLVKSIQQLSTPPPFYQVVMLNDDYTTVKFVVQVLQQYFTKSLEEAKMITNQIHEQGAGVCGVYSRDIAQTKVELVMSAAQKEQYPLQCIMEAV